MITFLNGMIVEKQPTRVIIEVGGIGYEVLIPLSSYDQLPAQNEACRLLTYDYVREDQHALYGFRTDTERKMFGMLMSISGIGPKLALSVLSGLSVDELGGAIGGGDIKTLSTIPGIGRKTAERIVVELRDRVGAGEALAAASGAAAGAGDDTCARDAVLALVSLGYKQVEARKMVKSTLDAHPALTNVEDIIRKVLVR